MTAVPLWAASAHLMVHRSHGAPSPLQIVAQSAFSRVFAASVAPLLPPRLPTSSLAPLRCLLPAPSIADARPATRACEHRTENSPGTICAACCATDARHV